MNNRKIIRIGVALIALAIIFFQYTEKSVNPESARKVPAGNGTALSAPANVAKPAEAESRLEQLFANRQSDIVVEVTGNVLRLLADDNEGSRHQKFIVELRSGHTVLVSHNIDLAARINALRKDDRVTIKGEYEWSERGGVVHWTHHDPAGRHEAGWIEHEGIRYE